jgi:hypothetical protein
MMAEWRELSTLRKIFYIAGLISFIGLALIILTGMTSIGQYENFSNCAHCACDSSMGTVNGVL